MYFLFYIPGFTLYGIICYYVFSINETLGTVWLILLVLNIISVLLMLFKVNRIGFLLHTISCVFFFPSCIIGILLTSKHLDNEQEQMFLKRVPKKIYSSKPIHILSRNSTTVYLGLILSIIGIILIMFTERNGVFLGTGIYLLALSIWSKKVPLLKIYKNHISFKSSVFQPARFITFNEITKWELSDNDLLISTGKGSHGRTYRLRNRLFNLSDKHIIIDTLTEQI